MTELIETIRLYDEDASQTEFSATVLSCEQNNGNYNIVLDKTRFFPEGGGQSGDFGSLYCGDTTVEVLDTRISHGIIRHVCASPANVGDIVRGAVNAEKRCHDMVTHTGEHMLSGYVFTAFGAKNVGFHMSGDCAVIDFDAELSSAQLLELESAVNDGIRANRAVQTSYPTADTLSKLPLRKCPETDAPLRVVAVDGFDMCACCGTHVALTGAVGLVKLLSCERHRSGCRISFICGKAALQDYRHKHETVTALARDFSTSPELVLEHVRKLKDELAALSLALASQTHAHAAILAEKFLADAIPADGYIYISAHIDGDNPALMRDTAAAITAHKNTVCLLTSGGQYILAMHPDTKANLAALHNKLREAGAKGGGRGTSYQGRTPDGGFDI